VPFAPDQYVALNLTIEAVDAVTGARVGLLAVGGAPVFAPGASLLIAERVSAQTGEHEFVLMGSAVSDHAVVLTASVSNCKPGVNACWSVTSAPLSVSVYSSMKAFPPSLVLLPAAELQLHLSGGPSAQTDVSRVCSTADAAVATVTSDGRVSARGVGSTTISVRLMLKERVVGSVYVPVTVALPTAITVVTGLGEEAAAPGLAVIVAGTTLQLSWRTPEGHTSTSLSGIEVGAVQAEWALLHAAVVSALPWPSVALPAAFNLAPRFAHQSAGARGLGALLTATPDAGAVHTTVGLSVRVAGLLLRGSVDVAVVPQLRVASPALLTSTTALLPAGTSTPVRTNLDALWAAASGGPAPSRHLVVASPPSEGRAALACGSVPRGSPPLHKAVVLEDRLASGTHAAFALVPTQRLSLILECARLDNVRLQAVAGSEGGVDAGADLLLGYGMTHALEVIGVDADGRPFGIGLGSLCPSPKGNVSCSPADLGLRTFVSSPTTVGTSLEGSGTADGRSAVLLRLYGLSVGAASVLAFSNWGARGAATAGDSIAVSVRGDVLPAGLTILLPFGEVHFSISEEALARVGLGANPLEALRASVRWSTSNATVAAEVPSLPTLHKTKRGRPAAALRPGRVVAFAPGSAVITASIAVRGSTMVLGSATVRVVSPASVTSSFARVTLDDLEAGATGVNAREVGPSFGLSDERGYAGGTLLVAPSVPGAAPVPALFVLRLRARMSGSGQQAELLTEDSGRVRQNVRFACGVSSGEWFRTAQVGPGAAGPALMAWLPPPLATFDKGWAGWEEASAEGGTRVLLAAAQTWPEASRYERLCAVLPVTGVSGAPLPDALAPAAPPMPPPPALTLTARIVTLDREGGDAVASVALQPATLEAAFTPALRLLPLALARTLLASGNVAAGWEQHKAQRALPLRSYVGAPPASAEEVILLLPSVGRPFFSVVLSAAAPLTAFLYGLPVCRNGEGVSQPCSPLLSSNASRLEVRLLAVEGGAVRSGWVQPSTVEALAALCASPATCPAAVLFVGVAPHLLDTVSRGGGRGNLSFSDSPLVITVEGEGTQSLALSCAFDDGSGIAVAHALEEEEEAEAPAAARSAVRANGPSLLARLIAAWNSTTWAGTVALVLLGAAALFSGRQAPPPTTAAPTQPTLVAAGGFVNAEVRMAVADLGGSATNNASAAGWHGGAARAGLFSPARRRFT